MKMIIIAGATFALVTAAAAADLPRRSPSIRRLRSARCRSAKLVGKSPVGKTPVASAVLVAAVT